MTARDVREFMAQKAKRQKAEVAKVLAWAAARQKREKREAEARLIQSEKVLTRKEKILAGISNYLGAKIQWAEIFSDPNCQEAYAIKARAGGSYTELLLRDWDGSSPINLWAQIEEVKFKSWPPKARQ